MQASMLANKGCVHRSEGNSTMLPSDGVARPRPPATDVLLDFTVPFSGGGTPAYLEIDKLPEGLYRATVGTLFEYQELCRTGNLEGLLRHARAVAVSRSFDDMVRAIRAMRSLDDSVH
jgi:hypothetical protein